VQVLLKERKREEGKRTRDHRHSDHSMALSAAVAARAYEQAQAKRASATGGKKVAGASGADSPRG
jgi:hypothetical protein